MFISLIFWLLECMIVSAIFISCAQTKSCSDCDLLLEEARKLHFEWRLNPNKATAPVLHFGRLQEQGMGSIIEHAGTTFVFATMLGRPYVLDLNLRGPSFTFGTLIEPNNMDWKPPQWMDTAHYRNNPAGRDHLHIFMPDEKKDDSTVIQEHLKKWSAKQFQNKILVSEGWGLGWFPHVAWDDWYQLQFPIKYNCSLEQAYAASYNFLFRPTNYLKNMAEKRTEEASSFLSVDGAIYLQTSSKPFSGSNSPSLGRIKSAMDDCTKKLSKISHWWVFSDDVEFARKITEMDKRYIFAYPPQRSHNHWVSGEQLQRTVIDWYLMHESKVALTNAKDAYAHTAVVGHQKTSYPFICGTIGRQNLFTEVYTGDAEFLQNVKHK